MSANEFSLKSQQEKSALLLNFDDTAEEARLSFCDLPLNSNISSDWDKSSSPDQDFFEFYSEEFTRSSSHNATDNIIFCGKLISFKGATAGDSGITKKPKDTKNSCPPLNSYDTLPVQSVSKNKEFATKKYLNQKDFPMKKNPFLGTTTIKSRWYLFAAGLGGFPSKMELSDIKARQSKRMAAYKCPPSGIEMVNSNKRHSSEKRAKGLWGLLGIMGCKGIHTNANAMVKASFGCIPQV